jgi:hypothetical protein
VRTSWLGLLVTVAAVPTAAQSQQQHRVWVNWNVPTPSTAKPASALVVVPDSTRVRSGSQQPTAGKGALYGGLIGAGVGTMLGFVVGRSTGSGTLPSSFPTMVDGT